MAAYPPNDSRPAPAGVDGAVPYTGVRPATGGRRNGRRWTAVLIPLVLTALVLGSLVALAVVGGLFRPPGAPVPSFTAARQAAGDAVAGYGDGFELAWAVGWAPSQPVVVPLNYSIYPLRGPTCSFSPFPTGNRTLSPPGSASAGSTVDWSFVFVNSSGDYVVVAVSGSTATLVGTLAGYGCPFEFPAYATVPMSVVDPAVAAGTALEAGGAEFLTHHPLANVTLLLAAPQESVAPGPVWSLDYTDCPAAAAGPSVGAVFEALINATDGVLISTQNMTAPCPWVGEVATVPLNTVLAVTSAFPATAGTTFYDNFTVRSVGVPLTAGTLGMVVQDASGSDLALPGSTISLVDATGAALATFDLGTGSWTSGASAAIAVGDQLSLRTGTDLSGQGDSLVLIGQGYFTGTVGAPIG